jgi:ribosome biogenesis protein Nip4
MNAIQKFAFQVGAKLFLEADLTVEKGGRYFLLNKDLLEIARKDFYYAGIYLGKVKNGKFFPSFNILAMFARGEGNKIVVKKRSAWLFICGRDIFQKGILAVGGSRKKGDHTLVLNEFGECLGYGRIICNLGKAAKKNEVAVKNVSDVGDFLRRERRRT